MTGTSKERFIPLRIRYDEDAAESMELFGNVPPHLFGPIAQWCDHAIWQDSWWRPRTRDQTIAEMCLDLRVQRSEFSFGKEIESLCRLDPDLLLDVVDWILHPENRGTSRAKSTLAGFANACIQLEEILFRAGSAWQVADPPYRLIKRVPEELGAEFRHTTIQNDPVSEHLRHAWNAAWRHDDPNEVEAYNSAVKALEASLAPIVIPSNPTATLGTIISALNDKPEKWDTRFRGPETVQALTAMLDELWKTNSRHAGMPPNDLDEAQDAVTIAVAVVALVRRGFITLKGNP